MTAYDNVIAALVARGHAVRNAMTTCPAHDDRNPSLSVAPGDDGRALLHCHAGCSTRDVAAAIGLTLADLCPPKAADAPTPPAVYDYHDADGVVIGQVVRKAGKKFTQRRADGTWRKFPPTLYRLPHVIATAADGGVIYVAEGEKDCDTLAGLGVTATTNPMGAGKWPPVADQARAVMAGAARIVIVADNDEPGIDHARKVAAALEGVAPIDVVRAARGNDVTDHVVTHGLTLDDLVPLDDELVDDPERDDVAPDGLPMTDVGNASRLIALAGGRLRYAHKWTKWLTYDRGRWTVDTGDVLVTEQAKAVAVSLLRQLDQVKGKEERARLFRWATRSETAGAIAALVRLARGIDGVLVDHEQLDADPFLLNVRNGTIDLRTGQLRPHDPTDLLTKQCPVRYDPKATAPLWRACLEQWQPDPACREYLQREAGAGTTGTPTETLSIHYGGGGNGKSKFWGAVVHVLGPYAVVPHKSLFVAGRHEQHATVVATLFRARLGVVSETSVAARLDEESIKGHTGADREQARRMREDEWGFDPTHTLVMFSNHRPTIIGSDDGVWRRVRLVPWLATFKTATTDVPGTADENLARKLADEAPGILNWLIEGASRFLAVGLGPMPPAIAEATATYRREQDTVSRFAAEVLTFGLRGWTRTADLRAHLERWAEDVGVPMPTVVRLGEVLRQHGCRQDRLRVNGPITHIWRGVVLADSPP